MSDDDRRQLLSRPNIRLYGPIGDDTVSYVLDRLEEIGKGDRPIVLELTTQGGDADAALRIALEIRLCRRWHNRETYFIGKTAVMSAGITIMSAFPTARRFLTDDTELLIHERRITKTVALDGPMTSNIQILREQLALVEAAERIERQGFKELASGSRIGEEELFRRAKENFYLTAAEALDLGLVAAVV